MVEAGGAVHPGLHLNARLICVDELTELQGVTRGHVANEHGDLGLVCDVVDRLDREHEALRHKVIGGHALLLLALLDNGKLRLISTGEELESDPLLGDRKRELKEVRTLGDRRHGEATDRELREIEGLLGLLTAGGALNLDGVLGTVACDADGGHDRIAVTGQHLIGIHALIDHARLQEVCDDCSLLDQGATREDVLLLGSHCANIDRLLPEEGRLGAVHNAHGGEGH